MNKSLAFIVQATSVHLIYSGLLSAQFHLGSSPLSKIQVNSHKGATLSCTWTQVRCMKSAPQKQSQSETDNKRPYVRICEEGPKADRPYPRPPSSTPSSSYPPSNSHPHHPSYFAWPVHFAKAQPALCKMLVYQLSLPLSQKVITPAILLVGISVSALLVSAHRHANSFILPSFF